MKVYLVRHGKTKWNFEGRWQGQTDIELHEAGIEDSWQAGFLLKKLVHTEAKLYASDLKRARQTAEIIGEVLSTGVKTRSDLRECKFGLWNGMTFEEISENCQDEFSQWLSEPDARLEGTESLYEVQERAFRAFQQIVDTETEANSSDRHVVIVSHALWAKVLLCKLLGTEPSNFYKLELDNCSIVSLELSERGYWKIKHLNLSPTVFGWIGGQIES